MKRAEGTGSPQALTLISVSRAGSSAHPPPADRHARSPRCRSRPPRRAACGEEGAAAATRWNRGCRRTPASGGRGRSPPPPPAAPARARRRQPHRRHQPAPAHAVHQRREVAAACGSHRSVWQPSEVLSVARTRDSRMVQYCGYMQDRRRPAPSPRGSVAPARRSAAPRLSPTGRRGEPVSAKARADRIIRGGELVRPGDTRSRAPAAPVRRRRRPARRWRRAS